VASHLAVWMWMFQLALAPRPAAAYTLKQTETGAPVRWAQPRIALRVDTAMRSRFRHGDAEAAVSLAVEAWRGYPGVPDIVVERGEPGPRGFHPRSARQSHGVYLVPEAEWTDDPHLLAVTVTTYEESTGRVVDADILVNDAHRFALLGEDRRRGRPERAFDLASVLAHEVGHVLGLGESEVPDATMWSRTRRGEVDQRTLELDDEDGVIALYARSPDDGSSAPAGCSAVPLAPRRGPAVALLAGVLLAVAVRARLKRTSAGWRRGRLVPWSARSWPASPTPWRSSRLSPRSRCLRWPRRPRPSPAASSTRSTRV
jgi:hypothetical protein